MTYNVFDETLNLAQSIKPIVRLQLGRVPEPGLQHFNRSGAPKFILSPLDVNSSLCVESVKSRIGSFVEVHTCVPMFSIYVQN